MRKHVIKYVSQYSLLRFIIVGGSATALHYGIYLLMLHGVGLPYNVAFPLGFTVSITYNFFASSFFTFRTTPTIKRALKFASSHALNFGLEMLLLNLFVWVGASLSLAPIFSFCVAFPVNFLLVRFALRK